MIGLAHMFKTGIAKQLIGTSICRIVVAASSVVFSIIIARLLGPSDTGSLFFALAILLCTGFIPRMGNDLNLVLYTSSFFHKNEFGKINGVLLLTSIVAVILSIILLFFASNFENFIGSSVGYKQTYYHVSFTLLALPALSLAALFAGCLKGAGLPGRATFLEQGGVFVLALPVIALPGLFAFEIDILDSFAIIVSCYYLMALIGAVWWFNISPLSDRLFLPTRGEAILFFRSSFNMGLAALAAYTAHWGNIVLVGLLSNANQTGLYTVADRIATIQYFALSIVYAVFFQRLSIAHGNKDYENFRKLAQNASLLSTAGAMPVLFIIIFQPELLLSLFGGGFSQATLELRLLGVAYFFSALLGAGSYVLIITKYEKALRNITLIGLLLQLALGIALIPSFGAKGAAMALLIAYFFRFIAALYITKIAAGFYLFPRF